jgi:hypothetical protein
VTARPQRLRRRAHRELIASRGHRRVAGAQDGPVEAGIGRRGDREGHDQSLSDAGPELAARCRLELQSARSLRGTGSHDRWRAAAALYDGAIRAGRDQRRQAVDSRRYQADRELPRLAAAEQSRTAVGHQAADRPVRHGS